MTCARKIHWGHSPKNQRLKNKNSDEIQINKNYQTTKIDELSILQLPAHRNPPHCANLAWLLPINQNVSVIKENMKEGAWRIVCSTHFKNWSETHSSKSSQNGKFPVKTSQSTQLILLSIPYCHRIRPQNKINNPYPAAAAKTVLVSNSVCLEAGSEKWEKPLEKIVRGIVKQPLLFPSTSQRFPDFPSIFRPVWLYSPFFSFGDPAPSSPLSLIDFLPSVSGSSCLHPKGWDGATVASTSPLVQKLQSICHQIFFLRLASLSTTPNEWQSARCCRLSLAQA